MNDLKNILNKRNKVEFWTIEEVQTERKEFYLCQGEGGVESNQSRLVRKADLFLEIWVAIEGERLGYGKERIFLDKDLEAQVESLFLKSQLASEERWTPTAAREKNLSPQASLCAHQFLEDFDRATNHLNDKLKSEISLVEEAEFNSAELFCTLEKRQILSSNDFSSQFNRSRIYAEVCFSSSNQMDSQEFLETKWVCRPEDIDFKELCMASVKGSQGLLVAKTTPSGSYTVKLKSDDVALVFSHFLERFHGASKYLGLPFFEKGSDFISGFNGQKFEIRLNPNRDFGLNSLGFDSWGRLESCVTLVKDNKVEENVLSQKYAHYLNQSPTLSHGVMEIEVTHEGSESPEEYLQVLQFSGLFIDGMTMTFSSEIRLGLLVSKDGSKQFVKGGNFSGSLKDNFSQAKWEGDPQLVGVEGEMSVLCPEFAYLNEVSVS